MMKRFFFLTSFFLCFSITVPLYAQENIPLRTGVRDGYARLTFGLKDSVPYTVDKSKNGKLLITFEKQGNIDSSAAELSKIDNVSAIKVISNNPLKIEFTVPKSSTIRDFTIGKRVVLDIYDPTDPADIKKPEPKTVQTPKTSKTEAVEKPETVKKAAPAKNVSSKAAPKISKAQSGFPAVPPAPVEAPENLSDDKDQAKKAQLKKAVDEIVHTISFRSTKSLAAAAFENYGSLWIITDGSDPNAFPALNSAKPQIFSSALTPIPTDDANDAYSIGLPDQEMHMKSSGGGLIWDIIIGEGIKQNKAIQPIRDSQAHGLKIIWPFTSVSEIVDFKDPVTGENLKIVLVEDDSDFITKPDSYIDFDVLPSPVGMAIRPKVDDLVVAKTDRGVEISRKSGLSASSAKEMDQMRIFADQKAKEARRKIEEKKAAERGETPRKTAKKFFDFKEWQLGSAKELDYNENILLSNISKKSEGKRVEDIVTLAKMFLSHGRGAEALGYFNFAQAEVPQLYENPQFRALTGVAKALDWKSDAALEDFLHPALEKQDEVNYWKAYVLADLGDWQQAASVLPNNFAFIKDYPPYIANRLSLALAEVALRDGRVKSAKDLLSIVEKNKSDLLDPMKAYFKYLKGEAYRQQDKKDQTKKIWKKLTHDKDDLFRTKAGLALTILLMNDGEINNEEAIDRLERLRYAWRGDGLEANINYWLGLSYFKKKKFIKGLSIMRDAASFAGDTALGKRIANHMSKTFSDLFLGDDLAGVSAVDAVAVYEEFSELTPIGKEGDKLVQNLAERLVKADLLNRAAKLLRHQVDHRLQGKDKLRTAIRLAAIHLIDKQPQKAMDALGNAQQALTVLSDSPENKKHGEEIELLKIRAFLQNKEYDRAIGLIEKMPPGKDLNRLKADVAWQAGYWDEAAEALNEVITDENISLTRPATEDQADLLLNRAIALSLSNDRVALSNLRAKYNDVMLQTSKARQFEVVTRPRGNTALADRETLLSVVSEVDLFKDFLESYRAN